MSAAVRPLGKGLAVSEEKVIFIGFRERVPARVLGCLAPGMIAVSLLDENGFPVRGLPVQLSVEAVPSDLRMPNSEFDLLYDPSPKVWAYTKVVRRGETEAYEPAV